MELKIKWPKGFSGIAKDLITKLLRIDPSKRLSCSQITDHPWFKSIPEIRPVNFITLPLDNNKLLQENFGASDYQVVSKPSLANKAEANEENRRQSVLDKKLQKVKNITVPSGSATATNDKAQDEIETARIQEIQAKSNKHKKENQELKF